MSRFRFTLAVLFCSVFLLTGIVAAADLSRMQQMSNQEFVSEIKIFQLTPQELDKVLPELHRRFPNYHERVQAIATMYVGASYFTEPFTNEEVEWMPYTKTNCTMFVLYTTAFLNARSYQEALEHMKWLHYKGGVVAFKNRYHFTSDRITDSANKYFTNVTEKYVKNPATLPEVTVTLNKKSDGQLLFGDKLGNWTRELTLKYIPRVGFHPDMLKELPATMGVAFVKRSNWKIGVIVGHEGILVRGDLYHSGSPSTGLYVIKDYLATEFLNSSWEGMFFFTMNQVPLKQ